MLSRTTSISISLIPTSKIMNRITMPVMMRPAQSMTGDDDGAVSAMACICRLVLNALALFHRGEIVFETCVGLVRAGFHARLEVRVARLRRLVSHRLGDVRAAITILEQDGSESAIVRIRIVDHGVDEAGRRHDFAVDAAKTVLLAVRRTHN